MKKETETDVDGYGSWWSATDDDDKDAWGRVLGSMEARAYRYTPIRRIALVVLTLRTILFDYLTIFKNKLKKRRKQNGK